MSGKSHPKVCGCEGETERRRREGRAYDAGRRSGRKGWVESAS
jgi:hypothetical protein